MESESTSSSKRKLSNSVIFKRSSQSLNTLSDFGQKNYYHYLAPELALFKDISNFQNPNAESNNTCSVPMPLYVASIEREMLDICHQRVAMFHRFNFRIRYNASLFKYYTGKADFKKMMKNGTYPTVIERAINCLDSYPYPSFSGHYDWYFTGGNLALNENYVVAALGVKMDGLNILKIKHKCMKSLFNLPYANTEQKLSSEVLEIQTSQNTKENSVVRCEKNIFKFNFDKNDIISIYDLHRKEVPFITFAEDPRTDNIILTGDLHKKVFLWDVNKSLSAPTSTILLQTDLAIINSNENWNCIRHFKDDSFIFTDFNKFGMLDCRQQMDANTNQKHFKNLSDWAGICERICALSISKKYANLIYIATTHRLYGVDVRYLNDSTNKTILLRWTHQMKFPPLILKIHSWNDSELIAASSHCAGEIRLFEVKNNISNGELILTTMIFTSVPDPLNSYYYAQLQGKCLYPANDFETRIRSCTVGLEFYQKNDKISLLIANSAGDILISKISKNNEIDCIKKCNTDAINKYYEAIADLNSKFEKKLTITGSQFMKSTKRVLRSTKMGSSNKLFKDAESSLENSNLNDVFGDASTFNKKRTFKWERSLEHYAKCRDILAFNLVSAWDFDFQNIDETKHLIETEEIAPLQVRVGNWISKITGETLDNDAIELQESDTIQDMQIVRKTQLTGRNLVVDNNESASLINDIHSSSSVDLPCKKVQETFQASNHSLNKETQLSKLGQSTYKFSNIENVNIMVNTPCQKSSEFLVKKKTRKRKYVKGF